MDGFNLYFGIFQHRPAWKWFNAQSFFEVLRLDENVVPLSFSRRWLTRRIEANYFGSQAAQLMGPVTLQAQVITHFGRPNEKRKSLTLRLEEKKETVLVGEVEF